MDSTRAWQSHVDFVERLAAISSVYRSEVVKKTEEGKPVYDLLCQAAQPDRLGWLFNNARARACMSATDQVLMPTGATSNESLHAELNGWFRQTQAMHKSALQLKVDIIVLAKLVCHNAALYSPTARQMLPNQILARRIGKGLWSDSAWKDMVTRNGLEKAVLPVEKQRQAEAQAVAKCVQKKPCTKRPSQHRTPSNLPRSQGISRAGVHGRSKRQSNRA